MTAHPDLCNRSINGMMSRRHLVLKHRATESFEGGGTLSTLHSAAASKSPQRPADPTSVPSTTAVAAGLSTSHQKSSSRGLERGGSITSAVPTHAASSPMGTSLPHVRVSRPSNQSKSPATPSDTIHRKSGLTAPTPSHGSKAPHSAPDVVSAAIAAARAAADAQEAALAAIEAAYAAALAATAARRALEESDARASFLRAEDAARKELESRRAEVAALQQRRR